jgi:hypothetical protein
MARAILVAMAVLLLGDAAYFVSIVFAKGPGAIAYTIWLVPALAALVASWIAPTHKFRTGLLVALPAAVLLGASNYVFELMGNAVDFPGAKGAVLVAGMSLPVLAVLSAGGALVGDYASKRRANA